MVYIILYVFTCSIDCNVYCIITPLMILTIIFRADVIFIDSMNLLILVEESDYVDFLSDDSYCSKPFLPNTPQGYFGPT